MDEFGQKVQIFSSTIYGSEMKESLGWCFNYLYDNIEAANSKLKEIKSKIERLEMGVQNAVVH